MISVTGESESNREFSSFSPSPRATPEPEQIGDIDSGVGVVVLVADGEAAEQREGGERHDECGEERDARREAELRGGEARLHSG